ncbi:hypothetical protein AVEN_267914-1 [Araneus ventricosus]|uniref:Uncharacterized protein n=1 Tax=Araneus ventricosus TaxID=182803 RepID=A0A4Y2K834_ARAVE|nr:hypothetical protein AVEN_267914-1 [Araneus ventricosus]
MRDTMDWRKCLAFGIQFLRNAAQIGMVFAACVVGQTPYRLCGVEVERRGCSSGENLVISLGLQRQSPPQMFLVQLQNGSLKGVEFISN